jgi:hypothetical protein
LVSKVPCIGALQEVEEFNCLVFLNKFAPRRKLLPQRRPRKPEPGNASTPRQLEIVVQAGVDLPVRVDDESATRPFVEISFQGNKKATTLKAGANPIWNQLIHLEMSAPGGDWSQQALVSLPDEIAFNLFDNVRKSEQNVRESNGATSNSNSTGSFLGYVACRAVDSHPLLLTCTVRTLREERRWLGGFSLPFSTLYRNGKVEGTFPLTMPPILLGYTKDRHSNSTKLAPSSGLALFITVCAVRVWL